MAEQPKRTSDSTTALGERAVSRSKHIHAHPGVAEADPSPATPGAKRPPLATVKLDPRPLRERFKAGKD